MKFQQKEILANPVYLGHMVQGKTRCSYFEQNGKLQFFPKENWIIVEGTHEVIVLKDVFEITQKSIQIRGKRGTYKGAENSHALQGKVKCGYCGYYMNRSGKGENTSYLWLSFADKSDVDKGNG